MATPYQEAIVHIDEQRQQALQNAEYFKQEREREADQDTSAKLLSAVMATQPQPPAPPVQPPMPGQGSVPMMPPPPPMAAGAQVPAPRPPSPMAPPMGLGAPTGMPPAPAGAPPAPPMPQGWMGPSPMFKAATGGPAPGGGPPAGGASPVAAGAAPGAGLPTPPPMGAAPPPVAAAAAAGAAQQQEPPLPGMEMPKFPSFEQIWAKVDAMPIDPAKKFRAMAKVYPMIQQANEKAMLILRDRAEIYRAAADTARLKAEELKAGRWQPAAPKVAASDPFMKEAAARWGEGTPEYNAAIEKHLNKMDAPARTSISVGAGGADLDLSKDPEALQFMTEQAAAGDTSVYQNLGRGIQGAKNIVTLRKSVAKYQSSQGKTGADQAQANAEFMGTKAGERTLGQRTANIEMAGTEAESLAKLALEASDKLPRTGIKSLNQLLQAGQGATASPELRAFTAANTSLINAYARAINPQGVGTVADKEHARDMMETAFSKGDYKAAVNQLLKEIQAARKAPHTVKESMRPGADKSPPTYTPDQLADAIAAKKIKTGDTFLDPDGNPHKVN